MDSSRHLQRPALISFMGLDSAEPLLVIFPWLLTWVIQVKWLTTMIILNPVKSSAYIISHTVDGRILHLLIGCLSHHYRVQPSFWWCRISAIHSRLLTLALPGTQAEYPPVFIGEVTGTSATAIKQIRPLLASDSTSVLSAEA